MTVQDLNNVFGRNITFYRERKGLSKAELCRTIGVNKNLVGLWENGKKLPCGANLVLLAQALGVEVWRLFSPDHIVDTE